MTARKLGEYVVYVLAGLSTVVITLGLTVLSMFVFGPGITVCVIAIWLLYSLYRMEENDKHDV